MRIVVTGGARFIGSTLVRHLIGRTDHDVLVIDKLTYAGNLSSLESVQGHRRYGFSQAEICDRAAMTDLFASFDPDAIINALADEPISVYGNGLNVRDWLFVDDHVSALTGVLERGRCGETYLIGGNAERRNVDVVNAVCEMMDALVPSRDGSSYRKLISFVPDRPGRDLRYAIDPGKLRTELGCSPHQSFEKGLFSTVQVHRQSGMVASAACQA
jgi:dTDP-D-glucose 4,6-dehydratase